MWRDELGGRGFFINIHEPYLSHFALILRMGIRGELRDRGLGSRLHGFILALSAAYLFPLAIPQMGIDYAYFFIMLIVLLAWFSMKWTSIDKLTSRGKPWEVVLGTFVVAADYVVNTLSHSRLGVIDMLVIFSGLVLVFYGLRSFKLFWVPATYGIVLLLGYQIENNIPNYVVLQDWMASVMVSWVRVLGITASSVGHLITLNSGANVMLLSVESDCTGIQGVLAFGMLSTMTLLDAKPKMSRLVPVFAIGFLGVFLINFVRLFAVVLTFEFLGVEAGTTVHLFVGYILFIGWVIAFWSLAFRYLNPSKAPLMTAVAQ
jgi:exosortase/archaeosortase family protein